LSEGKAWRPISSALPGLSKKGLKNQNVGKKEGKLAESGFEKNEKSGGT